MNLAFVSIPCHSASNQLGTGGSSEDNRETQAFPETPYLEPEYPDENLQPFPDNAKSKEGSDDDAEVIPEEDSLPVRGCQPGPFSFLNVLVQGWEFPHYQPIAQHVQFQHYLNDIGSIKTIEPNHAKYNPMKKCRDAH